MLRCSVAECFKKCHPLMMAIPFSIVCSACILPTLSQSKCPGVRLVHSAARKTMTIRFDPATHRANLFNGPTWPSLGLLIACASIFTVPGTSGRSTAKEAPLMVPLRYFRLASRWTRSCPPPCRPIFVLATTLACTFPR